MPISAGLREDIAVYRGFIGQQYIEIYYRSGFNLLLKAGYTTKNKLNLYVQDLDFQK